MSEKMKSNCPICYGYLFDSIIPVITLKCGHTIHEDCFNEYIKTNYICPICHKALCNLNSYYRQLDRHLQTVLYIIYRKQCLKNIKNMLMKFYVMIVKKSVMQNFIFYIIKYIIIYKCKYCGGYNTSIIKTCILKDEIPTDELPVDNDAVNLEDIDLSEDELLLDGDITGSDESEENREEEESSNESDDNLEDNDRNNENI